MVFRVRGIHPSTTNIYMCVCVYIYIYIYFFFLSQKQVSILCDCKQVIRMLAGIPPSDFNHADVTLR